MMPFDEREQEHLAFLYELYKRSAGDARQGIPYEVLIDVLGFDERVTKRIQRELQREGLVELTGVPQMTTVRRPVMDHAPSAAPSANDSPDSTGCAPPRGRHRDAAHGTP
jgi:hypothetical protein